MARTPVQAAADKFREAQHVAKVVGGRTATQQLETARAELSAAAGIRRR